MTEREAFEEWAVKQPWFNDLDDPSNGLARHKWSDDRSWYRNRDVECMWHGWKSRAAIEAAGLANELRAALLASTPAPAQQEPSEAERDARIAELERELEEARKDAERYQWLCGFSSVSMPELTWGRRAGIPKNKLDAAIDAAIKEQT